ncbi:MAG: DUF3352 domain-containing protein [Candidatus Portnoybacteria bacterium]|nr:DUF3352 domain-containing protein [Candidatus Portnoybacteria bacterium]MDD4982738.1 DUF3352 domain-containing protein [Candidatus Portnoybacteria bacterium]
MQPTQIKINKAPNDRNGETKNILNLNDSPAKPRPSQETKKYLWIFIALIILEGAAIIWLSLANPVSPYFKLLPQNLVASSYFNQSSLLALLKNGGGGWPLLDQGNGALRSLLNKINIEQPERLSELFEDRMALAVLPQDTDKNPTWLILAAIKASPDIFSQTQNAAEQALKQNYDLTVEPYRQIKIVRVKPLNQNQNSIFYAQTKNYFILSDNNETLKEALDKIIGR